MLGRGPRSALCALLRWLAKSRAGGPYYHATAAARRPLPTHAGHVSIQVLDYFDDKEEAVVPAAVNEAN